MADREAGRNAHLFTTLVHTDEPDLHAVAARVNRIYEESLPPGEVASIVKSASKRRAKTTKKSGSNAIFTTWGRKGGAQGTEAQRDARTSALNAVNQRKAAQKAQLARRAHEMRRGGMSLRGIAQALSVALRTVQRYLASTLKNVFTVDTNPARVRARRLLGIKTSSVVPVNGRYEIPVVDAETASPGTQSRPLRKPRLHSPSTSTRSSSSDRQLVGLHDIEALVQPNLIL